MSISGSVKGKQRLKEKLKCTFFLSLSRAPPPPQVIRLLDPDIDPDDLFRTEEAPDDVSSDGDDEEMTTGGGVLNATIHMHHQVKFVFFPRQIQNFSNDFMEFLQTLKITEYTELFDLFFQY